MIPLVRQDQRVGEWVAGRTGGYWRASFGYAFGYASEEGEVIAGVTFTQYNGPNIWVDLAIDDPRATRPLFRFIAGYAFGQLGCARLTLQTSSDNLAAQSLHRRLGAIFEARLEGAAPGGNDILISRLPRESRIARRMLDGHERQSPGSTGLREAPSASA